MQTIQILFDGPPGPNPGQFVEVENDQGKSINAGQWVERDDGLWALQITFTGELVAAGVSRR